MGSLQEAEASCRTPTTKQLPQLRLPSTFRMKCLIFILVIASATALANACGCCDVKCMGCQQWVQDGWNAVKNANRTDVAPVAQGVCKQVADGKFEKQCLGLLDQFLNPVIDWINGANLTSLQVCHVMTFCK